MPTPLVAVAWGGADNPCGAWSADDAASWTTVNLLVDDTERGLFHCDVQSGKILHGCRSLLGALMRPRFNTAIMGGQPPA